MASHDGTNGGAGFGSVGMLLNFFGVDKYTAIGWFNYGAVFTGVNGGVAYPAFPPDSVGFGLLLDVGGTLDEYEEDCAGWGDPTTPTDCGAGHPTGTDLIQFPKGILGMGLDV